MQNFLQRNKAQGNKIVIALSLALLIFAFLVGVYIYKVSMDQLNTASKCPPSVYGVNKIPFELTYKAVVRNIPNGAKRAELWMPYPQDTRGQAISDIRVESPYPVQINAEPEFGNKMMYITVKNPEKDFNVTMKIGAVRQEVFSARLIDENMKNLQNEAGNFNLYLKKDEARTISRRGIDDLTVKALKNGVVGTLVDKAKAMYDYLNNSNALDVKVSDELILSEMLKSQKIPADTIYGFSFKKSAEGKIKKYSGWTEFFVAGYGWLPADIASAKKFPKDKEYYFGNIDENRLELSRGRYFNLIPKQAGPALDSFIFPYAEIDGKKFKVSNEISWRKEL